METSSPNNTSGPDTTNLTSTIDFNATTIISTNSMITTEVYTTDHTNEPNLVLIIVPSAVAVVLILIVISVVIVCIAKRRRKPREPPKPKPHDATKIFTDERGNTYRLDAKGNKVYVDQDYPARQVTAHGHNTSQQPDVSQHLNDRDGIFDDVRIGQQPYNQRQAYNSRQGRQNDFSQEDYDDVNNPPQGTNNDFLQEDYDDVNNPPQGTNNDFFQEDYDDVDPTGDHGGYYDDAHSDNQFTKNTRYVEEQEDYEYPTSPDSRTSDLYLSPKTHAAFYQNEAFKPPKPKQHRSVTDELRSKFESPYLIKKT